MTIPRIAPYVLPTPTELPKNKVDWSPDSARAVLLVHDMQTYFVGFYDKTQSPMREVLENVVRLREQCAVHGIPVVYSAQPGDRGVADRGLLDDMWGPGLTAQPTQESITEELSPRAGERVMRKIRYSAFQRTELLSLMRDSGRDQLWICGVYAHIGCLFTAGEAFMNNIKAFMLADAVGDFSRAEHEMALTYVATRCGRVVPSQVIMDALTGTKPAHNLDALLREELSLLGLEAAAIGEDDALQDHGLDSVRLLELSERFHVLGFSVSMLDLMECQSLGSLRQYLETLS